MESGTKPSVTERGIRRSMESGTKRSVIGSWNQAQAILSQKHEIRHKTFCYRNTEPGTKSYYRNIESGTDVMLHERESGTRHSVTGLSLIHISEPTRR